MGFFAEFSAWLNQILSAYIGSTTAAVAAALEPALVSLGILYVMVWGYLTMTGKIEEPVSAGLKRILTLALILGCALQLWFYNDVIVDTFFVAPEQLAARIIGSYDSVTIVDNIILQGSAVAERLLEEDGIIDSITYGLAAIVVYIVIGITAIYAVFLLSLSRIALAVLLAIGPFFIALLLFETSKRFFGAWIAQLANYALIAILTTLVSAPAHMVADGKARGRSVSVSEQRRALLLPQEVKELGDDREIIIYEGVRPILARKNRYYEDRFFKKRLLPPPRCARPEGISAAPSPSTNSIQVATPIAQAESTHTVEAPAKEDIVHTREATTADIERIDSLTLDDFAVDFSKVEIPMKAEGERLTSEELNRAVNSFLTTLREQ